MTDNEQQIAIAEECGTMRWSTALPERTIHCDVPDYLNDLNASHEMEEHIQPSEIDDYANALQSVVGKYWFAQGKAVIHFTQAAWLFAVAHATCRQRAEAFLRMRGKWKD